VITIRDGKKTVASYKLHETRSDGSGSHTDVAYAVSPEPLKGDLDEYARGKRGPFERVVFYVLVEGDPKAGEYAGTVTIGDLKYVLFKK
jgi:hypothetical protein